MSDLDDRLLDLLSDSTFKDPDNINALVAQIHQYFTDAGYILPGDTLYKMPKGKDLARELAGLQQIIDNGTELTNLVVMMTGKEFYKEFFIQMSSVEHSRSGGTLVEERDVYRAAKRAAGLE